MGEDKICHSDKKLQCHICMLKYKGKFREIRELTKFPNVACSICGEEANSEDNVCLPVPLFI